jgi:CheY-like chemotaxis protein
MADVMVVEDNADLAESLGDLLHAMGHEVRTASNGEEGLHLLADHLPDVVLLDVEMPLLDGPGMAERMLIEDAGRERVPIMLMSGIMDLHKVAQRVGTPYYLGKPYGADVFATLLDRALAERRAPVRPS